MYLYSRAYLVSHTKILCKAIIKRVLSFLTTTTITTNFFHVLVGYEDIQLLYILTQNSIILRKNYSFI